ncbi:MAG: hypothetical protein CVU84_08545 [Firmicutes bacterium HGW-Firmicutes-1]|jgi:hypothetical protein|nr:MAG: hypothetical protein CVU84_08545 [Firmicutes bacterium HGW-Firmicutes-1]
MEKKLKFSRGTIIAAFISGVWLCLTLFILGLFKITIAWPAFMPFVLFTLIGWKTDQIKNIFCGGVVGILMGGLVLKGIYLVIGKTGVYNTLLIPIFIAIFLLVVLGETLPMLFNNYTFCFYTITFASPQQDTLQWLIVMLLGGAFYFGGMLMLLRLFIKQELPIVEKANEEAA